METLRMLYRKIYSFFHPRHIVSVKTGDRPNAGTSANVFMVMRDGKGSQSPYLKFGSFLWRRYLKRATKQPYKGPMVDDDFGTSAEIEIWMDKGGASDNWYCDVIEVHDQKTNEILPFPVHRWVKPDNRIKIPIQHTTLPQDDKYPEERAQNLVEKKEQYKYTQKKPGLPLQIKELPADEVFGREYLFDLGAVALASFLDGQITNVKIWLKHYEDKIFFLIKSKCKTSILKEIFDLTNVFHKPESMNFHKDDLWFAARKLVGTNPCEIELCTQVPEKFGVTDEMVGQFLEGKTLSQAAKENRLFIIDYHIVAGLPVTKPDDVEFPAPMALFYLDFHKTLKPIAIQLQQTPVGPEHPIFLPSDPANLWMLAKMWFNLADSMVHQSLSHLGFTHLLMEGICINTHRNLAMNHPVFRLLAHHFLYLLEINEQAVERLLSPDGVVEKTMQCGVNGMIELISRRLKCYRFDIDGCLPKKIKERGMDSADVIPVYPYRDDGLPVYYAIEKYVGKILNHYYDTTDKLIKDFEIQAWGREMVAPSPDGLGLKGIPNNGNFEKTEDLCMIITGIIFTCSAQHAVVNFQQYEEYAFAPNYPAYLNAKLPGNKSDVPTDEDMVDILADKSTIFETMKVTKILSMRATKSLGDWEVACQYDKFALKAEDEFREELKEISKSIKERNTRRKDFLKYDLLDPENIPNAISI